MDTDTLFINQTEIYEALNKLLINTKKDGADRKTLSLYRRKLETVETYWQEYLANHKKLCESDRDHIYFKKGCFTIASGIYQSLKEIVERTIDQLSNTQHLSISPRGPALEQQTSPGTSTNQFSFNRSQTDAEAAQTRPGTSCQHEQAPRGVSASLSKLDSLIKKQMVNFKALERTISKTQIEKFENKWQFQSALKSLENRWGDIDKLHWEIEAENGSGESEYQEEFCEQEERYSDLVEEINTKMWSVKHRESSAPQMNIPVFSGSYNSWVSFKDLFSEAIDKNTSLSSAQKMQFLKGKVAGEAERLIHHLQISSGNYQVCWEILNHRYGNKKLIFTTHINTLLEIPSMPQQSLSNIKRLHDVTKETLHAISNLGVDITTWDPLLVHLLARKLDDETFTEYVESIKTPRELPSLQEFLGYLEMKFTALEASRRKQGLASQRPTTSKYNQNENKKGYKNWNSNSNYKEITKSRTSTCHVSSSSACGLCNDEHALWKCPQFLNMTSTEKLRKVKQLNYCDNCLVGHSKKQCQSKKRCRKCLKAHNTLIHEVSAGDQSASASKNFDTVTQRGNVATKEISTRSSNASWDDASEILLATAVIRITGANGNQHEMRALVDQGSQLSLINEKAAQVLGLKRSRFKGQIFGVGEKENNAKGFMDITLQSNHSEFSLCTSVVVMNSLIKKLPNNSFTTPTSWNHIKGLQLADPKFNTSRPVDLLLGADVYSKIIMGSILRGDKDGQPLAQQTQLGWLLCGTTKPQYHCNVVLNNTEDLLKFWENEDISQDIDMSNDDHECLQYFINTTKRHADGKYEVRLPFKPTLKDKLGATRPQALAQFRNLERKLQKNEELQVEYDKFMNEYINLNHMEVTNNDHKGGCYLPHHAVTREESTTTKVRVVFNASAKSSTGYSLNDIMYKGPNIQKDLQKLILRWRQFKYAVTSDVEKMYRMIRVQEDDQNYQKIIWRDAKQNIRSFTLTTLSYGTKPAGFLAMMCLKQLAEDERHSLPEAAKELEECLYMDDYCGGHNTLEKANQIKSDLIELLHRGGFNLRKWASNKPELLADLDKSQCNPSTYEFKQTDSTKTLGLGWNPQKDCFSFTSKIASKSPAIATKRSLLSDISKLFDPIGWLTPLTTTMKILFQNVWLLNLGWDIRLPEEMSSEWAVIKQELETINQIEIKRWLEIEENQKIELHGFCDASNKAYACVIYCKITKDNKPMINLVAGKARLRPLSKSLSIPRLELMGAQLLTQLMHKVQSCLDDREIETYCWTDSTAVLGWIQGDPARWKPFVANRVTSITKGIPGEHWGYVKTDDNPADCASRGLTVKQLRNHSLWWNGPSWLKSHLREQENQTKHETILELKSSFMNNAVLIWNRSEIIDDLLIKFSSITKIIRIVAWILRVSSCRNRVRQPYLELQELRHAKMVIIKNVQQEQFADDINSLNKRGKVQAKSKILNLNPYKDKEGIIRTGGRLRNANVSFDKRHPIILPHNHRLTTLLIEQAHQLTLHGGARLTLANLRQQYWIIGGYVATKMHVRRCVVCKRHNPVRHNQLMGDYPEARINPENAFHHCGLDYTGAIEVKANKGRGIKTTKGYVAVFICMVTKAVHLEIVSELSSVAFLAALARMAARRGAPRHIYSDNGTNFVGANRMLKEEHNQLMQLFSGSFLTEVAEMGIQWHYNVPSWPNAGGLWERAVRSLKHHLKRVVGQQKLTHEEYTTLLAKIEACLNSRPLCALTEDPDDFDFLTPAHFLSGKPGTTIIETELDARTRWHMTSKLFQDLWKKWKSEYLVQLSARTKWMKPQKNIEIGELVVIHDENLPPGKWALGRVTDTHPGDDGLTRAVSLKTKNGVMKRPIVKLSVLPISQDKGPPKDPETQPEIKSSNRRPNRTVTPISIATITYFLLSLMMLFSHTFALHEVKQLPNNQTLYFDPISKIQIIRDKWTLIVYYDMKPYWNGMSTYKEISNYLDKLCANIEKQSQCNTIVQQARHDYQEIEYYNDLLLAQHFDIPDRRYRRDTTQTVRRRRGLIDGVGYLANDLFGVLDSRFADQYAKDIATITKNEKHLSKLWKNQTSVIEAEFNLMKKMETTIDRQRKMINKKMMEFQENTTKLQREIQNMSYIQDFTLSAMAGNNILQSLKRLQNTLLDTITDIYHGQISIHLLTPAQLKSELQVISGQMPSEMAIPIANVDTDFKYLYQLLKVKARATTEYVIIEITFPLVARESYQLYQLIPVPQQTNNQMVKLTPVSKYVAVNLKKDSYFTITKTELMECQHHGPSYICPQRNPIRNIKTDEDFCSPNELTKKCNIEKCTCLDTWVPLHTTNQHLYFCCDTYAIKILCGDQVTIKQLSGSGVITTGQGCIIKGRDFTLYSIQHQTNQVNISTDIIIPELDQINHIINIKIPVKNELAENESNLNTSLTSLGESIQNLKNSNVEVEDISYHNIHHYALGYVTLAGLVTASLVWMWMSGRCCRHRRPALEHCGGRCPRDTEVATPPPQRPRRRSGSHHQHEPAETSAPPRPTVAPPPSEVIISASELNKQYNASDQYTKPKARFELHKYAKRWPEARADYNAGEQSQTGRGLMNDGFEIETVL